MKKRRTMVLAGMMAVLVIAGGAGAYWLSRGGSSAATATTTSSIVTNDGTDDAKWSSLPTKNVTLTNDTYTITEAGTYVLSGSSTASVVVNSEGNVRLMLNGVTIKSTTGAAIYVQNAKNVVIELASGSQNTIEDATTRTDKTIDAAIYSSDDLILTGSGNLSVTSHFADAIASTDDLTIRSGTYVVTSADEGIKGKDSVQILGGTITVKSAGDGIKSTNAIDADKGYVYIKAGTITIDAGDDGINANTKVVIDGGTVAVNSSVEGIEGTNVTINAGTITVNATDDGINAASSVSGADIYIKITGGEVTVEVASGDTDCIDSNGNIYVTGGTIKTTNPSIGSGPATAFDYNGTAEFTGGTIYINGEQVSEIPAESMGAGMRR